MIVCMGVDPGFASTGVAGVAWDAGEWRSLGVRCLRTTKGRDRTYRRGMDDVVRLRVLWEGLDAACRALSPGVVGVELYTVYQPRGQAEALGAAQRVVDYAEGSIVDWGAGLGPQEASGLGSEVVRLAGAMPGARGGGRGLGPAAKTIGVWGVAQAVAWAHGAAVYTHEPRAIKRRFGSGGKAVVAAGVGALVPGLDAACEALPRGQREHVYDAAAHAVVTIEAVRALGVAT